MRCGGRQAPLGAWTRVSRNGKLAHTHAPARTFRAHVVGPLLHRLGPPLRAPAPPAPAPPEPAPPLECRVKRRRTGGAGGEARAFVTEPPAAPQHRPRCPVQRRDTRPRLRRVSTRTRSRGAASSRWSSHSLRSTQPAARPRPPSPPPSHTMHLLRSSSAARHSVCFSCWRRWASLCACACGADRIVRPRPPIKPQQISASAPSAMLAPPPRARLAAAL